MLQFNNRFTVDATLEDVSDFHRDPSALKHLIPPLNWIYFHRLETQKEGSISDFTLWLGFLPLRWKARHEDVDSLRGFTDFQIKGTFLYWKHRHEFLVNEDGSIEVRDEVTAEFGSGPFKAVICRLIWYGLPFLFFYRRLKTRQILQSPK